MLSATCRSMGKSCKKDRDKADSFFFAQPIRQLLSHANRTWIIYGTFVPLHSFPDSVLHVEFSSKFSISGPALSHIVIPHAPIVLPPPDAIQILVLSVASYFSTSPFPPVSGTFFHGKRIRTSPESLDFTEVFRLVLIIRYGHTFATISFQSGDDPKTVQENLGHHSAAFTLDVYGHVTDRMKRESAERMERFIRSTIAR